MKISPIGAGSAGLPVSTGRDPSRLEAAKAAYMGEAPPAAPPAQETTGDKQVDRIRRLKMKTQATPLVDPGVLEPDSAISNEIEPLDAASEETKPLSPQFAALAKQRRALQVKERELIDREKALETRSTTDGSQDFKAQLKSNPLKVLQESGVTYDELTNAIINSQSNPDIEALKAEIKALKEGVDSKFTDRDTQAEAQVLAEMRRDATALVSEGDDFEAIRETGSVDDAIDLIKRTWKNSGEVLDVHEALTLVEEQLIEDIEKVARIKKVQSRVTPDQTQTPQQLQPKQMRTLTSRDTAVPQLDRKARALAAFHGTLKK